MEYSSYDYLFLTWCSATWLWIMHC